MLIRLPPALFLLSRIREARMGGSSNSMAVAHGLSVTARVISATAAIMVVAFLARRRSLRA